MKQSTLLNSFTLSSKSKANTTEEEKKDSVDFDTTSIGKNKISTLNLKDEQLSSRQNKKSNSNSVLTDISRQVKVLDTSPKTDALLEPEGGKEDKKADTSLKSKKCKKHKLSLSNKNSSTPSESQSASTPDTLAYSDFLTQISKKGKDEITQHASGQATREESNVTKSALASQKASSVEDADLDAMEAKSAKTTMSYSDFLSLFKPAPASAAVIPEEEPSDSSQAVQSDNEPSKISTALKCKPISSFFLPKPDSSQKNMSVSNKSCSVTVLAEVHSVKASKKLRAPLSPIKLEGRLKTQPSDPDAIEFLSSETLETEDFSQSQHESKKRKTDVENSGDDNSKRQKIDSMESTEKDHKLPFKEKDPSLVSTQVYNNASSAVKKSQSQLCFGKDGLSLSKSKGDSEPEIRDTDMEAVEVKRKRGRPKKSTEGKDFTIPAASTDNSSLVDPEKIVCVTDGADDKPQGEESKPETPSLRRSSRISRPVRSVTELLVVNVDDDDEETGDERSKSGKTQRSKKQQKQSPEEADTPVVSKAATKKPKGPLAPIFTSMKAKEEVKPPTEDPEKVRLRQEFMMSGIPDELKRQIAASSTAMVTLDYPPFPHPSHVQQLPGDLDLLSSQGGLVCRMRNDVVVNCSSQLGSCGWEMLDWDKPKADDVLSKPFELFQRESGLDKHQQKTYLTEWAKADAKFKFEKVFTQLVLSLSNKDKLDEPVQNNREIKTPSTKKNAKKGNESDSDVEVIDEHFSISDGNAESSPSFDPASYQWTDLHQPTSSSEMIGNSAVLSQLKDWLAEWKDVMDKEVKKKTRLIQQTVKSKERGDWSDDSDDFTDSDEEDDLLCNTMLLTGPHGVGKTCAVYALAQELGYKVFEVSSSSLRSGKQILSQLEEATQSHRVAPSRQHIQQMDTPPAGTLKPPKIEKPSGKKSAKGKSMASAFANLFQSSAQPGSKTSVVQEKGKKSKRSTGDIQTSLSTNEKTASSGKKSKSKKSLQESQKACSKPTEEVTTVKPCGDSQNLATTSLILFDEVDIVFEEDKGFLATIHQLTATTKIPIVLTSTTASHGLNLQARHDAVTFRHPPMVSSVSYLCCVCLAHGVPVSRRTVEELLRVMGGDLRRCLLQLQFWCQSGGGRRRGRDDQQILPHQGAVEGELDTSMEIGEKTDTQEAGLSMGVEEDSNCCEFLSLRSSRRKKRMILDDDSDESSNSSRVSPSRSNPQKVQLRDTKHVFPFDYSRSSKRIRLATKNNATEEAAEASNLLRSNTKEMVVSSLPETSVQDNERSMKDSGKVCEFHLDLVESQLGLAAGLQNSYTIVDLIKQLRLPRAELGQALQGIKTVDSALGCNTLYQLALFSSGVPRCSRPVVRLTLPLTSVPYNKGKPKRKRILDSSLLDSEGSEDEIENCIKETNVLKEEESDKCCTRNSESLAPVPCNNSEPVRLSEKSKDQQNENGLRAGVGEDLESGTIINGPNRDKTAACKIESHVSGLEKQACQSLLSDLSSFYDSVAAIDTIETLNAQKLMDCGKVLSPGVSEEHTNPLTEVHCFAPELTSQLGVAARLLSARALSQRMEATCRSWSTSQQESEQKSQNGREQDHGRMASWPAELYLPIDTKMPSLWELDDNNVKRQESSTTKNVVSCLGSATLVTNRAVHTDYLPYLREICRTENVRQLAKTQRRFHHYLDSCGLTLKSSTIASLTSTFTDDASSS